MQPTVITAAVMSAAATARVTILEGLKSGLPSTVGTEFDVLAIPKAQRTWKVATANKAIVAAAPRITMNVCKSLTYYLSRTMVLAYRVFVALFLLRIC
jgi:hypothetical protein